MSDVRATLAAVVCLVRAVPLLFRARPHTPLRVLCIAALDFLHWTRHARPMRRDSVGDVATFLDFQACANAALDYKRYSSAEYEATLERLEDAGLGSRAAAHFQQLRELERWRPAIGGDRRRFEAVREYREAVARLSLKSVAGVALGTESLDDANRHALFRIVMQCQIVDDVLDYRRDLAAGLPTFMTACASVSETVAATAEAVRTYGAIVESAPTRGALPLRMGLRVVSAVAAIVVRTNWSPAGLQSIRTAAAGLHGTRKCRTP